MKVAFVDTLYLVALFNPRDQWHERAIAASRLVAETKLITTEDVLVELLNFFSEYGEKARRGAVTHARALPTKALRATGWKELTISVVGVKRKLRRVHCGLPGLRRWTRRQPHAPMLATWSEWQI